MIILGGADLGSGASCPFNCIDCDLKTDPRSALQLISTPYECRTWSVVESWNPVCFSFVFVYNPPAEKNDTYLLLSKGCGLLISTASITFSLEQAPNSD